MGDVLQFPEPFWSKQQIAEHYGFSTKWVELRMREGLPSVMRGGRRRYRLSEVEAFLANQEKERAA